MNNSFDRKINEVWITNNYKMFRLHDVNRDISKIKPLMKSMRKNGFCKAFPIVAYDGGDGFLYIVYGHHRYHVAGKLELPIVYMVVDLDECLNLNETENSTNVWMMKDFLASQARLGNKEYLEVKRYHEHTGIPLTSCIGLLAGNVALTGNYNNEFKKGTYRVRDREFAQTVAEIVIALKGAGIEYAAISIFVNAISKCVRVPEFDHKQFIKKAVRHSHFIQRQATGGEYMKMIESIYNKYSTNKLPLAFLAENGAKERGTFGKPKKKDGRKKNIRPLQEPDAKENNNVAENYWI